MTPKNAPETMMKTFAVALLISAFLVACGGKKETTTPVNKDPAMEQKGDATGGAAYGGKKADGAAAPAPSDNKANPSAPK
jgi:hypothetical protein